MTDLTVVTPSRGRPQNVARLAEAMAKTCRADTKLIIGLDRDDPTRADYPKDVYYVTKDPADYGRRVVKWINYLAMFAQPTSRAVGHFGDDCLPQTEGWDVKVLEALDKTPFAYGNDLSIERPPGALCTHLFMRKDVLPTLGYFGPDTIQHMWIDLVWHQWGETAGITYLHEVIIEHLHFLEGKAAYDPSYHLSRQLVEKDLQSLWEYVRDSLNFDLQKLVPGTAFVSGRDFLDNTIARGAPVPVPYGFEQLAGRR